MVMIVAAGGALPTFAAFGHLDESVKAIGPRAALSVPYGSSME